MGGPYKLEILPSAQTELWEIAQVHMTLTGPHSARKITDKIYHAMDQLTEFPLSGPLISDPQLRLAGYRYILAGRYLIFYRLLEDTIVVYHIAHGATDYPRLFSEIK